MFWKSKFFKSLGHKSIQWLVSICSGLIFTNSFLINFIRLFVYCGLIVFFFAPSFKDMSASTGAGFAFGIAIVILIIKLVLITMNLIVDHTQTIECPNNRQQQQANSKSPVIDIESDIAPETIPQELWNQRHRIPQDGPVTETFFSEMIAEGFDPNDVIRLVNILVIEPNERHRHEEEEEAIENELRDKKMNILLIFGHQFKIPFTRLTVNAVFTGNYSYPYAFVSFILNFIMTYLATLIMSYYKLGFRIWLSFIYGPALYSSLSPPEVDAYSTTRGDIYTGVMRPFSLSLISVILLIILIKVDPPPFYDELHFIFSWDEVLSALQIFCQIVLFTFPLLSIFYFGHPITTLTWLFEWISQYFAGQSGTSGIKHAFLVILRAAIIEYIIYAILTASYSGEALIGSCIICLLIIQIPLTIQIKFTCQTIKTIFYVIVFTFISFITSSYAIDNAYSSGDELLVFCFSYIMIFDIIVPYISSYSSYFICVFKVNKYFSKTISTLRLLTPYVIVPIALCVNLLRYPISPILAGFIIVMYFNKAFTEPHIVALAIYLQMILFNYELGFYQYSGLGMMYALWLSRKIISVYTITDFYARSRLPFITLKLDQYIKKPSILTEAIVFSIYITSILIPGPDRSISTIAYIWSFLTGSPFCTSFPCILIPMPPRPNHFWNQIFLGSTVDITRTYLLHRTEHPIETPVYTSMTQSLVNNLGYLVKTGKLGIVSSNSFFLFLSEPLAAFVHIISMEANVLYFQVRGLEYNDETLCHLGEIGRLGEDIQSYEDNKPNFISNIQYRLTDWALCAKDIKMPQYNVSKFEANQLFFGLDKDRAICWTYISLAYCISLSPSIYMNVTNPQEGELDERFVNALSLFSIQVENNDQKKAYKALSDTYFSSLFDEDSCLDVDQFRTLFHGSTIKIYQDSAMKLLLWFSLLAMNLGPDNDTKEEIMKFINDTEEIYFVSPIQNSDFNDEFEKGEKDLVSFEKTSDGVNNILFFRKMVVHWNVMSIQKEFVRSFWATDALQQIYFGDDNSERLSIQEDDHTLRNLIVQACDLPIGYPAFVSPILKSFSSPLRFVQVG